MKKIKKLLARAGIALGLAALLFLLFAVEENLRGRVQRWQILRRLRAQHIPLSLQELRLPAFPISGNTAPVIVQAAKELDALAKANPVAGEGPRAAMALGEPGRAAMRSREAAFPAMLSLGRPDKEGKPPVYEWLRLERELANAEAPLNKLRQALRQPVAVPVVDYGKDLSAPLESAPWRASRWVMSAAVDALHARNFDAALEETVSLLALAEYQRRDRRTLAQALAMTTHELTLSLIWEALQTEGWTDAQLERLQTALVATHPLDDALDSLELDCTMIPARFDQLRQSEQTRMFLVRTQGRNIMEDIMGDEEAAPYPSESNVWLQSALWWGALSHQDEARALELWGDFLPKARTLRKEKSWSAFAGRYPENNRRLQGYDRWRYIGSETLHPRAGRALLAKVTRLEAQRQMALAAVALKRFALRTGELPPTLAALTPDFLPEVPIDLMDGKPLRYRATDKAHFTLYSVGSDGRDDGGDPTDAKKVKSRSIWSGRDALWPTVAEPPRPAPTP